MHHEAFLVAPSPVLFALDPQLLVSLFRALFLPLPFSLLDLTRFFAPSYRRPRQIPSTFLLFSPRRLTLDETG